MPTGRHNVISHGFPDYLRLSLSNLFRPDAIFVDNAASPPSRYVFCQP